MYQLKLFYCNKIKYLQLHEKCFPFMAVIPKMETVNYKIIELNTTPINYIPFACFLNKFYSTGSSIYLTNVVRDFLPVFHRACGR